jgi:putative ABC transport system ATP-binding protein
MLEVQQLSKIYRMGSVTVPALVEATFTVPDGDMVCITGKSGSGKSTLLRQLGLLDRPSGGQLILSGQDVNRISDGARSRLRLRFLGYVFQEFALLQELTALENVFLPGMMHGGRGVDVKQRARELLDSVGLEGRYRHRPKELSGGEQQRVAIARALINQPRVLFADEPCANLDSVSSERVMQTLVALNRDLGITIVFVSHEIEDRRFAQHWLALADGYIVENTLECGPDNGPDSGADA